MLFPIKRARIFLPRPLRLWLARKSLLTGCAALFVSGCAQMPIEPTPQVQEEVEQPRPVVDDKPFPTSTLYSLLVAEMAGDRRRFDIMLSNYVQQAKETSDPGIAARAAHLARYLNAHSSALEMALLWLELQPLNPEAHYIAAAELIHDNQLLKAVDHATFLLSHGEATGFDAIGAKAIQGGEFKTTKLLIERYQELLVTHPNHTPLHLGISILFQYAGQLKEALYHSQQALKIEPDDFQAAAQETRVLQQMGKADQALAKLGALVDRNPDNRRLRLQYARSLLKTDLAAAQNQFETLLSQSPQDLDLLLTLALIEHERGKLDQSKARLVRLLASPIHRSTAHFYLARIALVQKNDEVAITHFKEVQPGTDYLRATSQITKLLVSQGEGEKAMMLVQERISHAQGLNQEQAEGLYLLQAQLYSNKGQPEQSINSLKAGIDRFPQSVSLIYSRALLFTQQNQMNKAEQDFMKVLSIAPDHAATLNAWGYTLADRSERLDEAYSLISRAYSLTPDDPAVIDSLGWVEYRRGNLEEAITLLRSAMDALPDHEIAAHLGEVLWVAGKQKEARQIWQLGLQQNPESKIIVDTMMRLDVTAMEPARLEPSR